MSPSGSRGSRRCAAGSPGSTSSCRVCPPSRTGRRTPTRARHGGSRTCTTCGARSTRCWRWLPQAHLAKASLESCAMKIAVCVKHVPEQQAKRIDPATKRLDRSGEGGLNPFDSNAIEEALRVKEATGDGEVVLVSLGPEKALDSMRKGLAMGADRAVLVSDDAAAGSDLVATSLVLAKALEREQADLVLFGQQASDSDGAVLWAAVADRLRRPMVSQVADLTVEASSVTGKRQTEFGYDVISASLPAVIAVSDAINEPRYPSLKGIMGAKSKPTETLTLAEIDADADQVGLAGSRTTVVALAPPPSKGGQVKVEDDGSAADKLVDWLAERKLV